MKLIEKKCPNCGGKLLFSKKDDEATCSYCNSSYIIDKDKEDIIYDFIDPDQFKSHFKMVQSTGLIITIISIIVFVAIFIFAIIMMMRMHRGF